MTDCLLHPGLPPPPPDLPRTMRSAGGEHEGDPPHFWPGGPVTWRRLPAPRQVRARDGKRYRVDYQVPWYLDRVAGVSRNKALTRLYDVLLHPNGWLRAGVHWRRVTSRAEATMLVRVIPQDETVCGPGSAGCWSWGYEPDGKPVAEMGVESIDNAGAWLVITGMEVCGHGTFNMADHYTPEHQPYRGSLGTWQSAAAVGFLPTKAELAAARDWLTGTVDPVRVHH